MTKEEKTLMRRDRAKKVIDSWSREKRAKEIAFLRTKGFSCNDDEELIDAYIGYYLDNGNFVYGLISIGILIYILYILL